jgi:hypothetical protein
MVDSFTDYVYVVVLRFIYFVGTRSVMQYYNVELNYRYFSCEKFVIVDLFKEKYAFLIIAY